MGHPQIGGPRKGEGRQSQLDEKSTLPLRGTFCISCLSRRGRDRCGLLCLRLAAVRAHRNFHWRRPSSLARARASSCAEIPAPGRRWWSKALAPAPVRTGRRRPAAVGRRGRTIAFYRDRSSRLGNARAGSGTDSLVISGACRRGNSVTGWPSGPTICIRNRKRTVSS